MRFRLRSQWLLLPAGIAWAAAVALGSARMLNYKQMPGAAGTPSGSWPADASSQGGAAGIRLDRRCANLVMVAHPHCPCSRASVAELARVMARARRPVAAHVLFYRPRQFSQGWERTDLWRSAAAIPGVTVHVDPEGREAERFGAVTSGHVLLYDRAGQLLFTGGITGARGHEGDNAGCDSVVRLLAHDPTARESDAVRGAPARRVIPSSAPSAPGARQHTFVYGCPIRAGRAGSGE